MTADDLVAELGVTGNAEAVARLAFEAGRASSLRVADVATLVAADIIRRHPGGDDLILVRISEEAAGTGLLEPAHLRAIAVAIQKETGTPALVYSAGELGLEYVPAEELERAGFVKAGDPPDREPDT